MKPESHEPNRREFIKTTVAATTLTTLAGLAASETLAAEEVSGTLTFDVPDSLVHPPEWETLNPGYWQVKGGSLRRRLTNYGDRARRTGFPFHYETHRRNGGVMNVEYDPSLPEGIIYRRDRKLTGEYQISATLTFQGHKQDKREGDNADWKLYQSGYGWMGIAVGAKNLFESYGKNRNTALAIWSDDAKLHWMPKSGRAGKGKAKRTKVPLSKPTATLKIGDQVEVSIHVKPSSDKLADVHVGFVGPDGALVELASEVARSETEGYFGIVGRGLLDFEVNKINVNAPTSTLLEVGNADCYVCYPLGDTLKLVGEKWTVRFVGMFASDGETAEVRVSDQPNPSGGWQSVPVCGRAKVISNRWRRNTSTIEVTLPKNPSDATLYYTVWKDGKNVTADPRVGSAGAGPGTGFVGDVPTSGEYIGRLPQLKAPYKICGLSCHAITSGLQQRTESGLKILGGGDEWQFRDQPTVEAYKHLDDYNFQIMCWEDDVWYMELVLYPPSTDDAYKVVTTSIAGPTSRWQMMRHWNVINPGDHDYGMDDVKGPEQIVLRRQDGLGQDRDYMRRNFQIVHHLITGDEEVDPEANPKKWRAWKMPNRDFTFAILDSRLWRSSQDTKMWDDEGWGQFKELYDRSDPTRSLLGEEQFAWLQELVHTDSSKLMCLTGLNGLHTVWTGGQKYSNSESPFGQRDRVAADYAGWVAAGADRVIELLGSRDGIVTVYGDVHNGCILKNTDHGLIECSFGPIGRSGGRAVIPGFGSKMKDFDGRPLDVTSLYHKSHANAELQQHAAGTPFYWNFLEMEFDPTVNEPKIGLRVRNLIDPPSETPRGGGALETDARSTGRTAKSQLPAFTTLPNADVLIVSTKGRPLRGTRSDAKGMVAAKLADVEPDTQLIVTAFNGETSKSVVVRTVKA